MGPTPAHSCRLRHQALFRFRIVCPRSEGSLVFRNKRRQHRGRPVSRFYSARPIYVGCKLPRAGRISHQMVFICYFPSIGAHRRPSSSDAPPDVIILPISPYMNQTAHIRVPEFNGIETLLIKPRWAKNLEAVSSRGRSPYTIRILRFPIAFSQRIAHSP